MPKVLFDDNTLTLNNLNNQNCKTMILKKLGSGSDKQINTNSETMNVTGDNEYIQVTFSNGNVPDTYQYTKNADTKFDTYGNLLVVWDGDVIKIQNASAEKHAIYKKT